MNGMMRQSAAVVNIMLMASIIGVAPIVRPVGAGATTARSLKDQATFGSGRLAEPDAAPPRPSVFYGSVRLDGADVAAGTAVSAWIDGVKYAEAATTVDEETSVYSIDVPADDPDTLEIEGGVDGQPVTFNVGPYAVDQRAFWRDGAVTSLHLTALRSSVVTPTPGVPTPTPGPTPVPVLHDTFDDGVIDDATWTAYAVGTGPAVAETNGRLEITMPAGSTGDPTGDPITGFSTGYESVFTLRGDFDVEVDYELLTWPADNGAKAGITTRDIETARLSWHETDGTPAEFHWSVGGTAIWRETTLDMSGKLRLVRSGSTMASYYYRDGAWVEFYTDSSDTQDLPLVLGAWASESVFSGDDVAVAFDNLIVRQGQLIFPSGSVAPPAGLVSWWPGQGNATDVVGANHGTLVNGVRFPDGNVGMAFNLNGSSDYVEIPDDPSLTPQSLSIDAWVKADTVKGDRAIMSKYDGAADDSSWLLLLHDAALAAHLTDARLRFAVHEDGAGSVYRQIETNFGVMLPGVWYHVAATFDAATGDMELYVNGAEIPSTLEPGSTTVETVFDSTTPVRIGTYSSATGDLVDFWDGRIDEVDLFARALTAGEVQAIYEAGSAGKRPPDIDVDADGVIDAQDVCPATAAGTPVDAAGCSVVCAGGPPSSALLAQNGSSPHGDSHSATTSDSSPTRLHGAAKRRLLESYGGLPLFFVENRGQLDGRVAYYAQGSDKTLYFTPDGITFALKGASASPADPEAEVQARALGPKASVPEPGEMSGPHRWAVKLEFVGGDPDVTPAGSDRLTTSVSYFKGARDEWQPGLGTFGSIAYPDLWPGIDLVYSGTSNRLKYQFLVKPGADPNQIRLRYRGATSVAVDDDGRLEVTTPVGGFSDEMPYAYQDEGAERVGVTATYLLDTASDGAPFTYGFRVGEYDRSRTLIIDPTIFIYSGYIGGSGEEYGLAIDVDSAGCAYVAGWTTSAEDTFPIRVGPDLSHNGGLSFDGHRLKDAFVAKVNAAGTSLIYAGFIGGDREDIAYGIAVDEHGDAYVAGQTRSSDTTFPVLVGPDLTKQGDPDSPDAFVTKISADGTELLYSGFIGGDGGDGAYALAIDDEGSAYVTGAVYAASDATFPVAVGPDLSYNEGYSDAFIAKVTADGTALEYAGYIGGSGYDHGLDVAVDTCGNAYIAGSTYSLEVSFPDGSGFGPSGVPGSIEGFDTTFNSGAQANPEDAFVVKVTADGSALAYATYLGGELSSSATGIAVDGGGSAYVTGVTTSDENSFPDGDGFGSIPGYDQTRGGQSHPLWEIGDAFVVKLDPSGTSLEYATYIGGDGEEVPSGYAEFPGAGDIAVDSAGNAYVTGDAGAAPSQGIPANFPVTDGPELRWGGGSDAFVAKLQSDGLNLEYAGYIGGYSGDSGIDVAVDDAGNAYVVGLTWSNEYINPFPVSRGPDTTYESYVSGAEAFVAKVGDPAAAAPPLSALPPLDCNPDADGDGVPDLDDACAATPPGTPVNGAGCPVDECYPLPLGAVGWWPAEDSADDSVGDSVGTTLNGAGYSAGHVGQAFTFDGVDDTVRFGNDAGNFGREDFTVEYWVKTTSTGTMSVFSKHRTCNTYVEGSLWDTLITSGLPYLVLNECQGCGNAYALAASTTVHDGSFHHVAFVRKGTELLVYVDGQLDASVLTAGITNLSNSSNLAAGLGTCWGYFAGELDEPSVYGRALIASEIQAIYLAGSAGKCPPPPPPCTTPDLVSWWPGNGHPRDVVSHHDGLRWNGATYALGRVGQAFSFDGFDDYVEAPDDPNQTPSSMTLDAWVMPDSLDGTRTIASKYDTTAYNRQVSWLLYASENGVVGFSVYGPEGWTSWRVVQSNDPVLTTGTWQHVAASFDGASREMAIYVDGQAVPTVLQTGATTMNSIMDSTAPVRIGTYFTASSGLTAPWAGQIDEVGLHSRVLTAAEIHDIYAFGSGGRCGLPNLPPTADALGPYDVSEGDSVTLNGVGEDPELHAVTFAWDLDDDGAFETSGQSVTFSADGLDGPSSVTVGLQVCDDEGACATDTATVTIRNVAPTIAGVSNDGPVDEASSATITVVASDRGGAGDPLSYEFDCDGDAVYEVGPQAGSSATCGYTDDGVFEATVRVTDGDSGEATGSTTVVVNNVVPTITDVTNDSPVDEGLRSMITVVATDAAGANDPLIYQFDCNDNGFYETRPAGNSAACPFSDNGTFNVPVLVRDGDGGEAIGSSTVVVDNVPPTATFTAPENVEQGSEFTLSLTDATDMSYKDEAAGFTYAFDCGEGGGFSDFTSQHTASCPTNVVGVRTAQGKIRDKDGGETQYAAELSVEGGVPEITAVTNDGPIDEGGSANITVAATHPSGPSEQLSYEFDCDNDGSYEVGPQPSNSAACTFVDDGTFQVNVRVADSDGDEDIGATTVEVNNVAPAVAAPAGQTADEGTDASFGLGSFADPGADTPWSVDIDWGDGRNNAFFDVSVTGSLPDESHAYGDNGIYDVTVTVTDDDGAVGSAGFDVTVANLPPSATFNAPTNVNEGQLIHLSLLNRADPSPADTAAGFEFAFDCGDGLGYGTYRTTAGASCTANDNGPRTVRGKIRDKDGGETEYTATVEVLNVAPTANPDTDDVAEDGPAVTIDVLANDSDPAGTDDPLTIIGIDTTSTAGAASFTATDVTYDPNGQFESLAIDETATDTFVYNISDGDGGTSSATVSVTIRGQNDGPAVAADNAAVTVNEGDTATNTGTFADVDLSDIVSISASVGTITQDTGNSGNWSWELVTTDGPDDGATVTITADDGNGGIATTTFDLVVNNVAPDVAAGTDQIVFENNTVVLDPANFTDPGDDTHTATIDWGDTTVESGTVDQGADTVSGSHVFPAPGTYTVSVTVEDGDGDSGSDSFVVTVVHGVFEPCVSANGPGDDLNLEEGATAHCSVRGEGKVEVKKEATVDGDVTAHSKEAKIEEDALVGGSVASDDKVETKKEASVGGDVTSGGDVKLEQDSAVGGDVTAGGKVDDNGATVGGAITEYANVPPLPAVTHVSVSVSATGSDVKVEKNETESLAAGSYGKLKVEEGATLTLGAGTYTFEDMDVHKDATLAFDLDGGEVVIDVEKKVDLKEGVGMTASGGGASDILFRVAGNDVKLGKEGTFLGTFVAPEAHIDMHEDAVLTGALYGDKVHLKKHSIINGDPALFLIIDLFVPDSASSPPPQACDECDGKVRELTLKYIGSTEDVTIDVEQKKHAENVFHDEGLNPGDTFTFSGTDNGTLGTEIKVYVDGDLNTSIHTSCSKPIGPGLVSGDFEVVAGVSKNGGALCPLEPPDDNAARSR